MTKRALINFNPGTLYIVLTPVYILQAIDLQALSQRVDVQLTDDGLVT